MRQFVFALALVPSLAAPVMAHDICRQLTIERHAILKDAGYCFTSPWAIAYFGNAGCRYAGDEVPLTVRARKVLASIMAREEAYGCRW